jgi:hypothetical protein
VGPASTPNLAGEHLPHRRAKVAARAAVAAKGISSDWPTQFLQLGFEHLNVEPIASHECFRHRQCSLSFVFVDSAEELAHTSSWLRVNRI